MDPLGAVASRGDTRGRKSLTTEVAIPPPPQYKGVHFAPQVVERRRSSSEATEAAGAASAACGGAAHAGIPVEGLPTRPAGSNSNGSNGFAGQQHPKVGYKIEWLELKWNQFLIEKIELVFCFQNCSDLLWEKFEILDWRLKICKILEIARIIYLNIFRNRMLEVTWFFSDLIVCNN